MNISSKLLDIYANEKKKSSYIAFADIPAFIKSSVICIEDHRFYTHCGIDFIAILRAFLTNLLNLRIIEGGSTITQQLVRELVLTKEKIFKRKLLEITLALEIEKKLSKQEILELYLNTCYFLSIDRQDVFGIHDAANGIFGKDCHTLDLAEASFLAALIGRPLTNHSAIPYTMRTIYRQHLILRYLLSYGKISRSDFDMATHENIKIFGIYKNDLPLEKIQDYNYHYIKPYHFLRPCILFIKLLRRQLRVALNTLRYDPIIFVMSRKHQLPFLLIKTVIEKESSFISKALSTKNAKGLMQVIDPTFAYVAQKYNKNWKPTDIFKPTINIEAGTLYLKEMIAYFTPKVDDNYALYYALAAYNAGPHNIDKALTLIEQHNQPKNWASLKRHLPSITQRYALYTIRYVESITAARDITDKPVDWGYEKPPAQRSIDTIIIHSAFNLLGPDAHSINGVLDEFKSYGVSSHYLIDRKGEVFRLVNEQNIAYHAGYGTLPDGRKAVNNSSIGIELIYTKMEQPNDAQYMALSDLINNFKKTYNIKFILGHNQVDPQRKSDPWNFDWQKLWLQ